MVERANKTSYGLGAGVMSENHKEINFFVRNLRVGTVFVNTYNTFSSAAPFGGFKDSGIGR